MHQQQAAHRFVPGEIVQVTILQPTHLSGRVVYDLLDLPAGALFYSLYMGSSSTSVTLNIGNEGMATFTTDKVNIQPLTPREHSTGIHKLNVDWLELAVAQAKEITAQEHAVDYERAHVLYSSAIAASIAAGCDETQQAILRRTLASQVFAPLERYKEALKETQRALTLFRDHINNPFDVYQPLDLNAASEAILTNGVLVELILRSTPGEEIDKDQVTGHINAMLKDARYRDIGVDYKIFAHIEAARHLLRLNCYRLGRQHFTTGQTLFHRNYRSLTENPDPVKQKNVNFLINLLQQVTELLTSYKKARPRLASLGTVSNTGTISAPTKSALTLLIESLERVTGEMMSFSPPRKIRARHGNSHGGYYYVSSIYLKTAAKHDPLT